MAALVVLNALGNVYDARGNFLAGGRFPDGTPVPHAQALDALAGQVPAGNTVLTVVATNVPLDKTQCSRLARMAAIGLARHIIPAHMLFDGDIVFTLASKQPLPEGHGPWNELLLGALAADAVAGAVCRAARPGMFA